MKHVFIAIPAYTGTIHLGTMRSLITDMLALTDKGHKVTIFDECGNAMIADCRALIVAKFLDSDATDLVFIDSDVIWQAGAILRLIESPEDFVAGIYPQRKDPIGFCVRYAEENKVLQANSDGLLEVDGVPAGFMKLSRNLCERMIKQYPETEFHCDPAPGKKAYGLFDPYRIGGGTIKLGEDYAFCKRWRDMGGKIFIDPELEFGHVGYKTFMGSLGDWLRENNT